MLVVLVLCAAFVLLAFLDDGDDERDSDRPPANPTTTEVPLR